MAYKWWEPSLDSFFEERENSNFILLFCESDFVASSKCLTRRRPRMKFEAEKKKIFFTNSSPLQAGAFFHCQKIFFIIQFKPVNSSRGTLKNALSASARRRFHYICQECYFCYQLWHNRVGNAIDNRWKKMKILFHLWLQPLSSSSSLLLFPFVRLQTWLRIGIKRRTDKKKDEKTLCEEIHN